MQSRLQQNFLSEAKTLSAYAEISYLPPLWVRLGLKERASVSGYELGKREPPLPVLLKYARLVGISTDVLIDDKLKLPR
jgi:transcriptional regulator with XRE-family HTH domain